MVDRFVKHLAFINLGYYGFTVFLVDSFGLYFGYGLHMSATVIFKADIAVVFAIIIKNLYTRMALKNKFGDTLTEIKIYISPVKKNFGIGVRFKIALFQVEFCFINFPE